MKIHLSPLRSILNGVALTAMFMNPSLGHLCAQETKPAPAAIPGQTFDDSLVQANVLFKQGKLDEALAAAQAAQKLDPKRYEAPATAALILHAAKKPVEAKAALDEAIKLAPPDKQDKVQKIAKLLATEPTAADDPPPLTGAARRQLDALRLIIEEADHATLDTERKKLLQEFLAKSEPFVKENPDRISVWALRAVAAVELDEPKIGWEAGRKMLKAGAENSDDPKTRKVLASLERRGWLGEEPPKIEASAAKSPVADAPAAKPPAEQQPKVLAFSDSAMRLSV